MDFGALPIGLITTLQVTYLKKWYASPSSTVISLSFGILPTFSIGDGVIKSGSNFVRDESANPCDGAIIRCYIQTNTLVIFISQQLANINGLWEIKGLNKKSLYTITAEYDGYEKVIISNVYPV